MSACVPVVHVQSIDLEELDREIEVCEVGTARGDQVRDELSGLAFYATDWQWVIHGDTQEYRQLIVEMLCGLGDFKVAKRLATCGLGDMGYVTGNGEARGMIRARRCMHRACPRCSRMWGGRALKKVVAVLSSRPHDGMYHMVLTQVQRPEEALGDAIARFNEKWSEIEDWRRKAAFLGGLATFHVKRASAGGWHYHAHMICELSGEGAAAWLEGLDGAWRAAVAADGGSSYETFVRKVCDAGERFTFDGDDGQKELWHESSSPVEKALQYVLRDVVQGVERWIEEGLERGDVDAFLKIMKSVKLHRFYGSWRKRVDEPPVSADEIAVAVSTEENVKWELVGSMDAVLRLGRQGVTECTGLLQSLLRNASPRSSVCGRLTTLLRNSP